MRITSISLILLLSLPTVARGEETPDEERENTVYIGQGLRVSTGEKQTDTSTQNVGIKNSSKNQIHYHGQGVYSSGSRKWVGPSKSKNTN